jgi:hypothetical protein
MKHLFIFAFMFSLVSSFSYAGQVDTECPWMKEQNERHNPKAGGVSVKPKTSKSKAVKM